MALWGLLLESALGWVGVCGSAQGVRRVVMGHSTAAAAWQDLVRDFSDVIHDDEAQPDVRERLAAYLAGEPADLAGLPLDLRPGTKFQEAIRAACRRIPAGETRSYAEVAAEAGRSGAARAVGNVMAHNPVPLLIPCHRVVASGGKLGGFSAPTGLQLKQRLLALEAASS